MSGHAKSTVEARTVSAPLIAVVATDSRRTLGAKDGASRLQKVCASAFFLLALAVLVLSGNPGFWFALAACPLFLAVIALQLGAAFEIIEPVEAPAEHLGAARSWPRYTVLVPLFREKSVLAQLVTSLKSIDYPMDSLEVFFLLEADDKQTADAFQAVPLSPCMHVIIVPPGMPRTKPRALNHGLAFSSGVFVTVFDAEDIPDPDQLKQAVLAFESHPRDVLCFQARLAIDNGSDGWLSLMMSIEYATLFDALKCGLAGAALPVPLGGTSNHFRGIM
jgi:glycosyltransferase XagB